jgi:pseudouridine kinase
MNITNREREILRLINSNPMISQDQIAEKLDITRSSVGVHISNMVKKNLIKGRGYVTQSEPYVSVIGGSNIDLQGSADNPLLLNDSNPGEISMSAGGVGRNIAENLSRISIATKMFSYVGADALGQFLIEKTQIANVDTSFIKKHSTLPTSQYLSVLDDNNDMLVSISDMRIINEMSIEDIKSCSNALNQSSVIVIDTNIPTKVIEYITDEYRHIPLFLDPVSIAKTSKIINIIGKFHTVKPNRLEAELITGIKINNKQSMLKAAQNILNRGCKQIFITLGKEGVFYYDGIEHGHHCQRNIEVKSGNGAGDAFVAGIVYGFLKLNSIKKTAEYASATAAIALKSKNTISDDLSAKNIELILKENKIETK